MDDEQQWLRLADAAELAGVSRSTLDRAARRDELPQATVAGIRHFLAADVDSWRSRRMSTSHSARRRRQAAAHAKAHAPRAERQAAYEALRRADEALAAAAAALRQPEAEEAA
jgi:predicted DNA-binding transcriptional regulator AlpA